MANLVSQFNSSLRTGVSPLTVNFTNTSTGPFTRVKWDFGDGSISEEINPSHKFTSDGVYQVTLTVYDNMSGKAESFTTITVFPDDAYTTGTTYQQALFTSKRFSTGQVAVRKTTVDGSVVDTAFPLSAGTGAMAISGAAIFETFKLSGNTSTTFDHDSSAHGGLGNAFNAGENVFVGVFLNTGTTGWNGEGDYRNGGRQLHMYKVTNVNFDTVTVDRPMVDFSGETADFCGFYFTSSGGTFSGGSWTKALQGAPAVDSFEQFESLPLYNPTQRASGTFNYFVADSRNGTTRLFVQPTYSGWNSVEQWKAGSVRLDLPYVMWHSKGTSGVSIIDSTTLYRDEDNDLQYSLLTIENVGTVVGKVYHEKKIIEIDEPELQACLSYTSNRNYSLPTPVVTTTSTVDGSGGLQTGVTYFVTYGMYDTGDYDGQTAFGARDSKPLHCRNYQTITPTVSGNKFRIQSPQSDWYTSSRTTSNDTGFTSALAYVMIGSGTTSNIGDATDWHLAFVGGGTPPALYSGSEIAYPAGTKNSIFALPMLASGNTNLNFGVDPLVIGYFSATAQSTIYKMSATCVAKNNEFNSTQNPTFTASTSESVYITEVALYNEQNELLMTGKLNTPIEKNDKQFVTIKMELDL